MSNQEILRMLVTLEVWRLSRIKPPRFRCKIREADNSTASQHRSTIAQLSHAVGTAPV